MNFYKIIHTVFGEYTFKTEATSFSRLASLLMQEKINFWGSETKDDSVFFCTSLFSAESVLNVAKQADINIELYKKHGLPFIFSRYRRRYGMLAGMVVFAFIIFFSQLFIWKIEINGNISLSDREIESALDGIGVHVGGFIPEIDRLAKANELLINCRELSSAAITVNGTHITVSVLERVSVPEIVPQNGFYNVISDYDGVVLDIDAADGTPEVREGDTVFKGELLINSFIEGNNGSFTPTHARGNVYAAVKESISVEIPMNRLTRVYTGNSAVRKAYRLLGYELPSFRGLNCDYEYFDAVVSERDIKLFGFIELPLRICRVTYIEYTPLYSDLSRKEAELFARDALNDKLAELDCEILECESQLYFDEKKNVCLLKANALVKRNIAREVPFEIIKYPTNS